MPQVDIEALVSVCAGDSKVACDGEEDHPDPPPDFPPESFWLSKDAEFDWFDRNAFLERRDSTKGNSNSSKNLNPGGPNPVSISSASQRYSKSKPSIIGLPKTHKTNFNKQRKCKPPSIQLFPKRTGSIGKSGAEPTSPKVSCMGRVRSKRGRRRSSEPAKSVEKRKSGGGRSTGIYGRFIAIFQSGSKSKSERGNSDPPPSESPPRRSVGVKPRKSASFPEPPALGGMTRFASGRRSAASYEDLEH